MKAPDVHLRRAPSHSRSLRRTCHQPRTRARALSSKQTEARNLRVGERASRAALVRRLTRERQPASTVGGDLTVHGFGSRALALTLIGFTMPADGQQPAGRPAGQPVVWMGQPPIWKPYLVAGGAFGGGVLPAGATAVVGVHRAITNPVTGLFGMSGEAYGMARGGVTEGGGRLLAQAPVLAIGAGLDWK